MNSSTILISPFSQKLPNGKRNAKNFPHWVTVIEELKMKYHVIQVGVSGEEELPATELMFNKSFHYLSQMVKNCHVWLSVDNFFHHFCTLHKKPGIVIFGKSDPEIFGHPSNLNMLKSRDCLRHDQFNIWHNEPYDDNVWVTPEEVVTAVSQWNNHSKA